MFSFSSLFIFILIISVEAFPQQDSLSSNKPRGIFHNGTWAVQIQNSKYSRLTGTNDLTISARKYLSKATAIRAGVSVLGLLDDEGYNYSQSNSHSSVDYSLTNTGTSLRGTQLFLQYMYYPVSEKSWNLFLACGPSYLTFTQTIGELGYNVHATSSDYYIVRGNNNGWGMGALFSLGAEWIPYKNFGITAEYGYLIVMTKSSLDSYTQHSVTAPPTYSNFRYNSNPQTVFSNLIIGLELYL